MASFIKSAVSKKDWPYSEKEVVFVGRSNVGKSTLINGLYKNKLAYTGKTPGKTRLLNFFDVDGYTVCDVPGYGFANRSDRELELFGDMMEEYFGQREALRLAIVILDIRHKPTRDDLGMIEYLKDKDVPFICVLNKADKLSNNQRFRAIKEIASVMPEAKDFLPISALEKTNLDKLKAEIAAYL